MNVVEAEEAEQLAFYGEGIGELEEEGHTEI